MKHDTENKHIHIQRCRLHGVWSVTIHHEEQSAQWLSIFLIARWRFIFFCVCSCFEFYCIYFLCVSWNRIWVSVEQKCTKISHPYGYGQTTPFKKKWIHVAVERQKKCKIYFLLVLIWIINHVYLFCTICKWLSVCVCATNVDSITSLSLVQRQKKCGKNSLRRFNCWHCVLLLFDVSALLHRYAGHIIDYDNDVEWTKEMRQTNWRTIITSSKWNWHTRSKKRRKIFQLSNALAMSFQQRFSSDQTENGNRLFKTWMEFKNSAQKSPFVIIICVRNTKVYLLFDLALCGSKRETDEKTR